MGWRAQRTVWLIGVLVCYSALSAPAQANGLLELYGKALLSDPVYASARSEREAADTLVTQARGQLLPQLNGSWSKTRNDQNVRNTLLRREADFEFTSRSASLDLRLALFRPQLWAGYLQSEAQVLQAEGSFRQAHQDLIIRLSGAYFDVLLAEDNVALAREQKNAVAEQLAQAKRYFSAGVGTVTDINEAQARYDTIVAQEIAAENTLEVRIRSLEMIVGETYRNLYRLGDRLRLESPLPNDVDAWLTFAHENNPQIKSREAGLEVAQREVQKSLAAHLPTVDVVASRSRSEDPSYTTLNTRSWNDAVGVQVNIPLFSGGTTQGRADQSAAFRRKAENDLESARRATVLSTRQEYLNVVSGVAQVRALEQSVKSNELALYSARRGQEAGMRTSFDVLNAQQLVFSAKRDLAKAKYDYVMARLKLRAAAGLVDESDIILVDGWLESLSAAK